MKLVWQADRTASALTAAAAVLRGGVLVDSSLARHLRGPVGQLQDAIEAAGVGAERLFEHLLPLASDRGGHYELAQLALNKTLGPDHSRMHNSQLAGAIQAVLTAFSQKLPHLDEQLPLRAAPLKQQWEARGVGMLSALRRIAGDELLPSQARVVLIQPISGGGGTAFVQYNIVHFEALLANADDRLPEIVRLGWLLSQLNFDLPCYSEGLDQQQVRRLAPLAMVPLSLFAAESVEAAWFDQDTVRRALEMWRVPLNGSGDRRTQSLEGVADVLLNWGQTWIDAPVAFPAALKALDRLLASV